MEDVGTTQTPSLQELGVMRIQELAAENKQLHKQLAEAEAKLKEMRRAWATREVDYNHDIVVLDFGNAERIEVALADKEALLDEVTWKYVRANYRQPEWCSYPNALNGIMGCWSLIDPELRLKISRRYCRSCDFFVKEKP